MHWDSDEEVTKKTICKREIKEVYLPILSQMTFSMDSRQLGGFKIELEDMIFRVAEGYFGRSEGLKWMQKLKKNSKDLLKA